MSGDSFYGVTLTGENNTADWDMPSSDEGFSRGLIIKQILLGADAKQGEVNVVAVYTVDESSRIPIAVLKAGETRAVNPDLEIFETSLSFQLISGNGPVYIHGQNIIADVGERNHDLFDYEDGEEEEETDEHPKKKQKLENNGDGKNAKDKEK